MSRAAEKGSHTHHSVSTGRGGDTRKQMLSDLAKNGPHHSSHEKRRCKDAAGTPCAQRDDRRQHFEDKKPQYDLNPQPAEERLSDAAVAYAENPRKAVCGLKCQ